MDKPWKQRERKIAAAFGTKRKPLSGSGGREDETRSDSKSDVFFIEAKSRKVHTTQTLYDATKKLAKKEKKIPVLALATANRPGFLVCVHSDDLAEFVTAYIAEMESKVAFELEKLEP